MASLDVRLSDRVWVICLLFREEAEWPPLVSVCQFSDLVQKRKTKSEIGQDFNLLDRSGEKK